MKTVTEHRKQPERQSYARTYQTPRLKVYGAVRELTNGGTGNTIENSITPPQAQPNRERP